MINPIITVQDYCEYYLVSIRTAIRYRNIDRKQLGVHKLRLSDWMKLNSTPPPGLLKSANKCQIMPMSAK